jgi:hypothetical protein
MQLRGVSTPLVWLRPSLRWRLASGMRVPRGARTRRERHRPRANDDFGQAEPARFAANAFAANGSPVYLYRFSYVQASMRDMMRAGAPHGGGRSPMCLAPCRLAGAGRRRRRIRRSPEWRKGIGSTSPPRSLHHFSSTLGATLARSASLCPQPDHRVAGHQRLRASEPDDCGTLHRQERGRSRCDLSADLHHVRLLRPGSRTRGFGVGRCSSRAGNRDQAILSLPSANPAARHPARPQAPFRLTLLRPTRRVVRPGLGASGREGGCPSPSLAESWPCGLQDQQGEQSQRRAARCHQCGSVSTGGHRAGRLQ